MYLASPHETGPLAEHISIAFYVAAICDPNMSMFVMSREPVMLEDALNYSIRYKALLLGATEQTQAAVLDPASYVYDDKGRKKEPSVRAVEVQQYTKQQDLEKSLATQKALNDESQQKLAEQQTQLDQWRAWNDEQTRFNGQAQPAHYDWRQSNYWSSGGQQGDTRQYGSSYRKRPGRGRGTHTSSYPQGDTNNLNSYMCYNCGVEGHMARQFEQQSQPRGATVYRQSPPATAADPVVKMNIVTQKTARNVYRSGNMQSNT